VYANFRKSPKLESDKTIHDLYEAAIERSAEHAAYLAKIWRRTLDEQLDLWNKMACCVLAFNMGLNREMRRTEWVPGSF